MDQTSENLINGLIKDGYLKSADIIEAFRAIDRHYFVSEGYHGQAHINAPLPIGFGQTISQPLTVAFMLELLQPKKGEKILDIGCGSGWTSALLAHIVSKAPANTNSEKDNGGNSGQSGKIIAIERIAELKKKAEQNIEHYKFVSSGAVQVILGDGSKGYQSEAPFDKIIAGAAAEGDIPEAWKKQLKIGGRIVAPVGNSIAVIDKISQDDYRRREYFGFSFVPLVINN